MIVKLYLKEKIIKEGELHLKETYKIITKKNSRYKGNLQRDISNSFMKEEYILINPKQIMSERKKYIRQRRKNLNCI